MSLLDALKLRWISSSDTGRDEETHFVERRAEARLPVFKEATIAIEDYYKIRSVIVDLSPCGARVRYTTRIDLPSRVRLSSAVMRMSCWARVVWQKDGVAGLEFLPSPDAEQARTSDRAIAR